MNLKQVTNETHDQNHNQNRRRLNRKWSKFSHQLLPLPHNFKFYYSCLLAIKLGDVEGRKRKHI